MTESGEERLAAQQPLVSLASQTVITAANAGSWDSVRNAFVRLWTRYDPELAGRIERELDLTRAWMTKPQGPQPASLQEDRSLEEGWRPRLAGRYDFQAAWLEKTWQTRLAQLLDEHPDAAEELGALVERAMRESLVAQPGRRYLKRKCPESIPVGEPFSLLVSVVLEGPAGYGVLVTTDPSAPLWRPVS